MSVVPKLRNPDLDPPGMFLLVKKCKKKKKKSAKLLTSLTGSFITEEAVWGHHYCEDVAEPPMGGGPDFLSVKNIFCCCFSLYKYNLYSL